MEEYEIRCYRVVYYARISYIDQYGKQLSTKEKHGFPTREGAIALRDKWVEEGKLKIMRWGSITEHRPTEESYTSFEIVRREELIETEKE